LTYIPAGTIDAGKGALPAPRFNVIENILVTETRNIQATKADG
jgi:hypothetical protein